MSDIKEYVLIGFALLILVFALVGFTKISLPAKQSSTQNTNAADPIDSNGFKTISTGSTDAGDVSIELTPFIEKGRIEVDFAANTHSVSLNEFDLSKITTLTAEGLELKPVSAPVMGGHHVKGKIVFAVGRDLESFTITINGIPSVDERVYHWDKP